MNNKLTCAALFAAAILGGIVGGNVQAARDQSEIETAWDGVTVVRDGTLIPNPSAYAYDPSALATGKVTIVDNSRAASEAAIRESMQ